MDKDLKDMKEKMEKCLNIFKEKINKINSNNNIENLKNLTIILDKNKKEKIENLSTINIENKNIIIKPFNKEDIKVIEEKIKKIYKNLIIKSYKDFLEIKEEKIITKEELENIIKLIKTEKELSKISLRNIRKKIIGKGRNDNRVKEQIQKIINDYSEKIDKIYEEKIKFIK